MDGWRWEDVLEANPAYPYGPETGMHHPLYKTKKCVTPEFRRFQVDEKKWGLTSSAQGAEILGSSSSPRRS